MHGFAIFSDQYRTPTSIGGTDYFSYFLEMMGVPIRLPLFGHAKSPLLRTGPVLKSARRHRAGLGRSPGAPWHQRVPACLATYSGSNRKPANGGDPGACPRPSRPLLSPCHSGTVAQGQDRIQRPTSMSGVDRSIVSSRSWATEKSARSRRAMSSSCRGWPKTTR